MSTATVSVITSTEVRSFGDRPVTSYERIQTFAVCAITNYRVNRYGEQIADLAVTDGIVYVHFDQFPLAKITASPD